MNIIDNGGGVGEQCGHSPCVLICIDLQNTLFIENMEKKEFV